MSSLNEFSSSLKFIFQKVRDIDFLRSYFITSFKISLVSIFVLLFLALFLFLLPLLIVLSFFPSGILYLLFSFILVLFLFVLFFYIQSVYVMTILDYTKTALYSKAEPFPVLSKFKNYLSSEKTFSYFTSVLIISIIGYGTIIMSYIITPFSNEESIFAIIFYMGWNAFVRGLELLIYLIISLFSLSIALVSFSRPAALIDNLRNAFYFLRENIIYFLLIFILVSVFSGIFSLVIIVLAFTLIGLPLAILLFLFYVVVVTPLLSYGLLINLGKTRNLL